MLKTRRFIALLTFTIAQAASAQSLPQRIADSTFWRMITEMSEPGGYFRSDNFVSNEASLQYVIPDLLKTTGQGGVYLGVAPDQNFTYLVALQPKIAFIVDIRRQNMLHHLMYKALIERSADRAEFISRLFSRPRPANVDTTTSVEALFLAYAAVTPDSAMFARTLTTITETLTKQHGFTLSPEDLRGIEYVFTAFYGGGPTITYAFPGGRGNFGRGSFPTFETIAMETDGQGAKRGYLANETNYRILRDMEMRNVIVPLVGDFAGPKTLRGVGDYLRAHGARVSAFYTSNVEQYLFQQGDDWKKFHINVGTLPIDSTSMFIRSLSNYMGFRPGSPNGRSVQVLSSIVEQLKAFTDGRLLSYGDVAQLSK
jgi:hypothetical protein